MWRCWGILTVNEYSFSPSARIAGGATQQLNPHAPTTALPFPHSAHRKDDRWEIFP